MVYYLGSPESWLSLSLSSLFSFLPDPARPATNIIRTQKGKPSSAGRLAGRQEGKEHRGRQTGRQAGRFTSCACGLCGYAWLVVLDLESSLAAALMSGRAGTNDKPQVKIETEGERDRGADGQQKGIVRPSERGRQQVASRVATGKSNFGRSYNLRQTCRSSSIAGRRPDKHVSRRSRSWTPHRDRRAVRPPFPTTRTHRSSPGLA